MPGLFELSSAEPQPAPEEKPSLLFALSQGADYFQQNQQQLVNAQRLDEARNEVAGLPESWQSQVIRRLPFVGAGFQVGNQMQLSAAQQRINAGQGQKEDYFRVAQAERLGQIQQEQGTGGKIGESLLDIPKTLVEFGAGQQALGLAGPASTWAQAAGRTAATTAAVPSMWLPGWTERNVAEGREPFDIRGLPSSYAMGYLQTAVFGSLGRFGNSITGDGIKPVAQRLLVRTGAGVLEKQGIDVLASGVSELLPKAYKLETGYGVLGAAFRGQWGEAWQHLAVDLVTFAAFSGLHEVTHGPPRVLNSFETAADRLAKAGVPRADAVVMLGQVSEMFAGSQDMSRAQAQELAKTVRQGPLRDLAQGLADAWPDITHVPAQGPEPGIDRGTAPEAPEATQTAAPAQTGQIPAEPPPTVPTATPERRISAPMVPEQAAAALAQEQARMQVEGRNAARRPETEAAQRALPEEAVVTQVLSRPRQTPAPEHAQGGQTLNLREFIAKDPELAAALKEWQEMVEKAFAAAGLTAKEKHVVRERVLNARSHEDIAGDTAMKKPDGGTYKRQRVEQIEAKAMEKLGLDRSVEEVVHAQERLDRALDMVEKGQRIGVNDLTFDPKVVERVARTRKDFLEMLDSRMEALADRLIKEKEAGKLTPAREKETADEFARLDQERKSGYRRSKEAPGQRGGEAAGGAAGRPGAVRRGGARPVPSGPEVSAPGPAGPGGQGLRGRPQGAPPAEAAGGAEANEPAAAPAGAGGGAAGRRVLSPVQKTYAKLARDLGLSEPDLHGRADRIAFENQDPLAHNNLHAEIRKAVEGMVGRQALNRGLREAERGGDAETLRRLDEVPGNLTGEARSRFESLLRQRGGHASDLVWDILTEGKREVMTQREVYERALGDLREAREIDDAAAEAKKDAARGTDEAGANAKVEEIRRLGDAAGIQAADERVAEAARAGGAAAETPEAAAPARGAGERVNAAGELVDAAGNVLFNLPATGSGTAGQLIEPGAGTGRGGVGPFEIIAKQNELFGGPNYIEGRVPHNQLANAVTLPHEEGIVTSKRAAGDPLVNLEEQMHLQATTKGFESNPVRLDADVANGFRQFWSEKAPLTPRTMIEGLAAWAKRRVLGQLTDLSPEQQAAANYAENWATQNGVAEKLDQLRPLYDNFQKQSAAEQAAGLVSPTAKVVEQKRGMLERIKNWFHDNITDNLAVLSRAGATKVRQAYSRLMFANENLAKRWEADGIGTIIDGKYTVIGDSIGKITEGLDAADLAPMNAPDVGWWDSLKRKGGLENPDQVTRAGLFTLARHILSEHEAGRPVVPDEQLKLYQQAMEEFKRDPGFIERATAFADKLTNAYNAGLRALAAPDVHRLPASTVDTLIEKRPDYVPTTRVREDADWGRAARGRAGENMSRVFHERTGGSGEQIVDPLVNYKLRLRHIANQLNEQLKRNALFEWIQEPGHADYALMGEPVGETPEGDPYAERVPWPKDGRKATVYWYGPDGKLQNARIHDRALYDLVTNQQGDSNAVVSFFKALGNMTPVRFLSELARKGATALSVGFQFRNISPLRDPYEFAKNTIDQASVASLPEFYKRAYAGEAAILRGDIPADVLYRLFRREGGAQMRQFSFETPGIETARSKTEIAKQLLNVLGAGEHGPRFLEFVNMLKSQTGKSEAELTKMFQEAEAAGKRGERYQDPVDWATVQAGMEAANEVTVPFSRQGILTREINKTAIFFGPAVSGMAKAVRNWRENTKGAAIALSAYLAARLIHWSIYHDEDWYKELTPHDRFNNFVVPIPGLGLRRIPGPRDLEVPIGGLLTSALDKAAGQRPDFAGLVSQSWSAVAPPAPAPPFANVAWQLGTNQNWMGQPIVPRREENTPFLHRALDYQLPYAAEQLTGGGGGLVRGGRALLRGEGAARAADVALNPFSEVRNAHRSVDEVFDRLNSLEGSRTLAQRRGRPFEQEREYQVLRSAANEIRNLSRGVRGDRLIGRRVVEGQRPAQEQQDLLRRRQLDIARRALASTS